MREKKEKLSMYVSKTFLIEFLPTRKEKKRVMLPTQHCDLTNKEKEKRKNRHKE